MKTKILLSTLLALTMLLAACAPQATAIPATRSAPATAAIHTPTPKPPTLAPAKKATAIPTKPIPTTAAATPTVGVPVTGLGTSTSTPANSVFVLDQLIANSLVMIQSINAAKSGWIVIHADNNGQPGDVIGYAAVHAGKSLNVKVTIDSTKITPKLYAMLHIDAGKIGTFEFPGVDQPVMNGTQPVMVVFNISLPATSTPTKKP